MSWFGDHEGGRAVAKVIGRTNKNRNLQIIEQDTNGEVRQARASLESQLDSEELLRQAAAKGDLETVSWALNEGIVVDCVAAANGVTPLMLAAQNGHVEVVRQLCSRRASVHREDRHHEQPLIYAFKRARNPECVAILLDNQADVDASDASGRTLLMLAACGGVTPMMQQLLIAGAEPYAACSGSTALHLAIQLEQHQAVATLLSQGVDPCHRDSASRTPLMLAARAGSPEMVDLLFQWGADPVERDAEELLAVDYCGDDHLMLMAFWEHGFRSSCQWKLRQCCLKVLKCNGDCCWGPPQEPVPEPAPAPAWVEPEPAPASAPEPTPEETKPRKKLNVDYRGDDYLQQLAAKGKKKSKKGK